MEQKHMWNQKIILYYSTLLILLKYNLGLGFMVFNTTFNNISVISWRSVLLVEETEVPGENHRPAASH
jgi:energy-converting hydrogenase Eha subunit E